MPAQVVAADGRILRAAEDENSDLFWAIRGGGGNYGMVTEFDFRLHEVGPVVHLGLLFWSVDDGAEMLGVARDTIPQLPRDINIIIAGLNALPGPFVPESTASSPATR